MAPKKVDTPEEKKAAMLAVQAVFDKYHIIIKDHPEPLFDRQVMKDAKLIDASSRGACSFKLTISTYYGNINGVMHGGAAGVIFDMLTTVALAPLSKHGYWDFLGGVTRSLNISYLRAIPIGTTIRLNSEVVQAGGTMALIKGEMVSLDGKYTYATVEHHKVRVPTRPEHTRVEYDTDWDRLEREKARRALQEREERIDEVGRGKSSKL